MTLTYHTFYAEYQGRTAQEILSAIHQDAQKGTGQSYSEWWGYQQKLWSHLYGIDVPDAGTPHAVDQLLDILVKVGALETGPSPRLNRREAKVAHG